MSENHIIDRSAEVHFTTERDDARADKVEFLPGGYVKLIFKNQYQVDFIPPHQIEGIHTHTSDEEEESWS